MGSAGGFRPSTHQASPRQVKVGQSDQREHLGGVLRDPLVAHLRVAELALDDAEDMLDARADRGHLVVETPVRLGQSMVLAGLERHAPEHAGLAGQPLELVIHVAFVAEHCPIILTHKVRQLADIRGVRRCHRNRVHKSGIHVGTDMDFHAEVPLFAMWFLRNTHCRMMQANFHSDGRNLRIFMF